MFHTIEAYLWNLFSIYNNISLLLVLSVSLTLTGGSKTWIR